jgi:hypothetical protein
MFGRTIGSDTDPFFNSMKPLTSFVRRELLPPVVQDKFPPTDLSICCEDDGVWSVF